MSFARESRELTRMLRMAECRFCPVTNSRQFAGNLPSCLCGFAVISSDALKVAVLLPIGDGIIVSLDFEFGGVDIKINDRVAEASAGEFALVEKRAGFVE